MLLGDKVIQMMNELGGWIDAEEAGLRYDAATSICDNCPSAFHADENPYTAPSCCKDEEDYQYQEWETIFAARKAVKALLEFAKKLNGESDEDNHES